MTVQAALAGASTVMAVAFALATLERFVETRGRHHAAWAASLTMFAAGAFALTLGATGGWNVVTFRAFYLFGAITNVPFLALGSIYLLAGPTAGDRVTVVLVVLAAFAAGVVLAAPTTGVIAPDGIPQGSDVFGALPRIFAAVGSAAGAVVVFGGAAWSAWRSGGRLAGGNVLLAVGTLVLSAGGLGSSVLDEQTAFAVSLLVGVTLLFAGFLVATSGPARRPTAAIRAPTSIHDAA